MLGNLLINNMQIALFFSPDTTFRAINVANAVEKEFGDIFTEDPNIITLPPNAPVEIPRIIYNREDIAQFSIGFSRADFSLKLNNKENWQKEVRELGIKLQRLFINTLKIRIIRIGMIATYEFNLENSVDAFLSCYIKSDKLANVAEYNMSWLKKAELNGVYVNKWVRLFMSDQPIENRMLVIDINTIAEQVLDLKDLPLDDLITILLECLEGEVQNVI